MRHVLKADLDKDSPLKLATKSTYNNLKELCKNKNKNKNKTKIKANIYREPYETPDEKMSRVADQLANSYLNKCAYCECLETVDIEHYRPKGAIAGEKHDGYFWLCYEWTNLIPACVKCNREGGKGIKFPIKGKRVMRPPNFLKGELDLAKFKANVAPLIDEQPDLLHPEIDFPEDYFEFEVDKQYKGIRIKGIDSTQRGKQTITICKLNRQSLRIRRQKNVIDDAVSRLNTTYAYFINRPKFNVPDLFEALEDTIKALIENSENDENEHTLLRKYIVKNSDNFIKIVVPFIRAIPREQIIFVAESVLDITPINAQ